MPLRSVFTEAQKFAKYLVSAPEVVDHELAEEKYRANGLRKDKVLVADLITQLPELTMPLGQPDSNVASAVITDALRWWVEVEDGTKIPIAAVNIENIGWRGLAYSSDPHSPAMSVHDLVFGGDRVNGQFTAASGLPVNIEIVYFDDREKDVNAKVTIQPAPDKAVMRPGGRDIRKTIADLRNEVEVMEKHPIAKDIFESSVELAAEKALGRFFNLF
ncbi:hypothetical protein JOF28_001399 [Leucobacter exalbidus]|uniref:Uncharacterized protein n=1 Tax=Leucobacter exalbidus TaxID=662960 RepID=A0A940PLK1_9MICO|nr:hypothetical protein [Leucobacter exalbidus]MBP1326167.1 hypothetical protein [Leucobacter exalbidus]